eukprot:GHVR01024677.1.p1 GENE.GHVR01024677.1~~GHVR01024677.1.p1  ORF type:complete len:228 (-),score=129.60 GHVR01024677.1:173-778(-)
MNNNNINNNNINNNDIGVSAVVLPLLPIKHHRDGGKMDGRKTLGETVRSAQVNINPIAQGPGEAPVGLLSPSSLGDRSNRENNDMEGIHTHIETHTHTHTHTDVNENTSAVKGNSFKCPFVPIIPFLGIFINSYLIASLGVWPLLQLFIFLSFVSFYYFVFAQKHSILSKNNDEIQSDTHTHTHTHTVSTFCFFAALATFS